MKKRYLKKIWKNYLVLLLILTITLLTACGGSDESDSAEGNGEVIIGLTDADGDFLSYAVKVGDLTLTKKNGTVIDTIPLAEDSIVDFAQYTELTEFFTAATIPVGTYVKATMTLDYTDADIQVEVNGEPATASVQDADGNPIETLEVSVSLENHGSLKIVPGVPAHLTLDFDLEASNTVDLTDPASPVVTVSPLLAADLVLEDPKDHRVRGLLHSVNEDREFIKLTMRPFFKRVGNFGNLKAHVNDETTYEINEVSYVGSEGLETIASLEAGSWVVVYGALNIEDRQFKAREVYAGSSVPGADKDAGRGVVRSRTGDELLVRAGTIVKADGNLLFNVDIKITVDELTPVYRQLSNDAFNKDDISVGQRITFVGTMEGNSTEGLTMSQPERVRMLLNQVAGDVVSTDAVNSEMALDLEKMNGRRLALFDFTGTGIDNANDADKDNYEVNTGTLDITNVQDNDPVKVRGFVSAFGTAPADFDAQSIIAVTNQRAKLVINWVPYSDNPFNSITTDALVIEQDDITGPLHHVRRKGVHTDLTTLENDPVIQPNVEGKGLFAIHQGTAITLYHQFDEFALSLSDHVEGPDGIKRVAAEGYFDNETATLTAHRISVILHPGVSINQ